MHWAERTTMSKSTSYLTGDQLLERLDQLHIRRMAIPVDDHDEIIILDPDGEHEIFRGTPDRVSDWVRGFESALSGLVT